MAGAPEGNQNAKKGKLFESALKRALARAGANVDGGLNDLCDQLVAAGMNGEQWAIKEIADRIDGKPAQSVYVGDSEDNPHYVASDEPLSDDEWIKQYGSVETSKGSAKVTH